MAKWEIPLSDEACKELQGRLVKHGSPVRFLDKQSNTVVLENGERQAKHVNVMYKTHYWNFDRDTISLIEQNTGLRAIISE